MKNDTPYPVVYEDHDGSWTWSIEMGEPFEPDHRVLATDQGYPNRKEAKEALEQAMESVAAKLDREKEQMLADRADALEPAPTPGATPPSVPPEPDAEQDSETHDVTPSLEASLPAANDQKPMPIASHPLPTWGVYADDRLIALFADEKLATAYQNQNPDHELREVELTISAAVRTTN